MDTATFLDYVVAPGNFIAVAYKPNTGGMRHRFFHRADTKGAGGFMAWCGRTGIECWYGVASYKTAEPDKKGNLLGPRTQQNAHHLGAFWADFDVKREGDGKPLGAVFATGSEAIRWIGDFCAAAAIPLPNLWVSSGYGLHVYWTLEEVLAPAAWKPYADALKAALVKHGAINDVMLTGNAACILRAPGTLNLKVPASPAPVVLLRQNDHYKNETLFTALAPYVGAIPQAVTQTGTGPAVLQGGPATVFQMRQQPSRIDEAAREGAPEPRKYLFANIATQCEQAKRSLADHGATDKRDLWYLGWITLAVWTEDGEEWAHEITRDNAKYSPADTDYHLALAREERDGKGFGPPTCVKMNGYKPGVCPSCPHWGVVKSPLLVGAVDGDLPDGYRRGPNKIEYFSHAKKDGGWKDVLAGNALNPILDRIGEDLKLTFSYEFAARSSVVAVMQSLIPTDAGAAMKFFGPQGVSGLYLGNATRFGAFLVAWIKLLRSQHAERADPVPAFGWVTTKAGAKAGFAVAGKCYRADGSVEEAPGGDPRILQWYRPRGTLAGWQEAAELVLDNRPDLQVLAAAAFGSPLLEFTGHSGFTMSAWSRDSAVGKSSALMIGSTVWAVPDAMIQLDDTPNSIVHRIGQTRITPAYWDEITLSKDDEDRYVGTLFQLGQGKEKSRLNPDASLKESGTWKTILCSTGNRPLMDTVIRRRADTDAGAVRLFEFAISHPQLDLIPAAQKTISGAAAHAGCAGAVYARWLGEHAKSAAGMVESVQNDLQQCILAKQSERFFVSGMACLLVGAAVANGIGLYAFDIPGMRAFLCEAFLKLREARVLELPVNNGVFDIGRVLADFVAAHTAARLVTNKFARPGPGGGVQVVWLPRDPRVRLAIHVARDEAVPVMRLDRAVLRQWLRSKGYSPSDTLSRMHDEWSAFTHRAQLGSGTDFATGQTDVIDIFLNSAPLSVYRHLDDSAGRR
jgi:hypothetical protein